MLEIMTSQFVILASVCALMLAGIHAYLGFHIVSRGVIFVDLSLAQAAALGAVFAVALGHGEGSTHYLLSLTFTFAGAAIISIAKTRDKRIPQEAFIGILYVGCAALTILLLAHMPGGMEELQHMLAGSLLTVSGAEIVKFVGIFGAVGLLHYVFRNRFFTLTADRDSAEKMGWNTTWWDFLFYSSFGLVVTSAVPVAGVLLVFSLLVIPPVTALLITTSPSHRLMLGWVMAFIGSFGGIVASVGLNLPTGPSIISVMVAMLIVVSFVRVALPSGS